MIPDSDSEDDESDEDVASMPNLDHHDLDPDSDSDADQAGGAAAVSTQDLSQSDVLEESLVEPWTSYVPNAPEDEETPLPCSFPEFLAFTEVGYETALQTYLDLLDSNVFPEFQKATDIMGLLRTKGVKVFVPQNWKGVRVQPLHIDFIEGMPILMKPRARPVNPKLFEHAHKELLRLLTYMFVRCDGLVACPLVIAPKATAALFDSAAITHQSTNSSLTGTLRCRILSKRLRMSWYSMMRMVMPICQMHIINYR